MNTILIADDDESVRSLCRLVLENEGYSVLEAEDVPTCVAQTRAEKPNLVLLDWMMPGVDGMDALRILKSSPETRSIPVVMLTALDGMGQITEATYNGADGYVTKPFEVDDLLFLIQRFVQQPVAKA